MRMRCMIVLGAMLVSGFAAAQDTPALKSQKEKLSYALGMNFGSQLRELAIDVDPAVFEAGLKDALSGKKGLLTEEEVAAAIGAMQAELKQKQAEARRKGAEDNKKAGEAFLAENKKKEGVVALPSGLQYKILKEGNGKKPTDADTVICNYRGTLINGTEFDSSYRTGQPATFKVAGVIPGWTEALRLMAVGSKWQLFIPAELAYGERGAGPAIGPNATLIFEVELVSIQDNPEAGKQARSKP
ncbi:MAG TPA: FKBP-type peptidyl-prolyl cis-trans isomerase [Candidatus Acidoferrales bacterium]|nr:FKBP-type peptidyl-prolyl cis-trans isomerase [Candidatus Acidoferrales bacterium]